MESEHHPMSVDYANNEDILPESTGPGPPSNKFHNMGFLPDSTDIAGLSPGSRSTHGLGHQGMSSPAEQNGEHELPKAHEILQAFQEPSQSPKAHDILQAYQEQSQSLSLVQLIEVLHGLLEVHDVRLCFRLLEHLQRSSSTVVHLPQGVRGSMRDFVTTLSLGHVEDEGLRRLNEFCFGEKGAGLDEGERAPSKEILSPSKVISVWEREERDGSCLEQHTAEHSNDHSTVSTPNAHNTRKHSKDHDQNSILKSSSGTKKDFLNDHEGNWESQEFGFEKRHSKERPRLQGKSMSFTFGKKASQRSNRKNSLGKRHSNRKDTPEGKEALNHLLEKFESNFQEKAEKRKSTIDQEILLPPPGLPHQVSEDSEDSSDSEMRDHIGDGGLFTNDDQLQSKGHFWFNLKVSEENAAYVAKPTGSWIIHPNHMLRMLWDFMSFMLIIAESVIIPLALSFDIEPSDTWFFFTLVFFSIDIFLSCITGFFHEGMIVMRQNFILRKYLFTFFILDFISTFPWDLLVSSDSEDGADSALLRATRFAKFARMARLLRLFKLKALLARLEDLLPHSALLITLSMVKMLGLFALLCHWATCIWGFLGHPGKVGHSSAALGPHDPEECERGGPCERGMVGSPWQRRYGLDRESSVERYIVSLTFATGIITGGEPVIVPGYWIERIYVILLMVVSFLICSVILSQIVVVVQKINEDSVELRENLQAMKAFMTSQKVPLRLQGKIKRYIEFQHKCKKEGIMARQVFLDQLSPWLSLELTEHLNSGVILHHPFFQELPHKIVKRVCGLANVMLYAPGDYVVQRGNRASCMCFILRGKLRILKAKDGDYADSDGNGMVTLEYPSWIGDMCLFKDMVRTNTAVAVTHTEVLTIGRDAIQSLLVEFPKMQPIYQQWMEKVLTDEDAIRCDHCNGLGHSAQNCPKLAESLMAVGKRSSDNAQGRGSIVSTSSMLSSRRKLKKSNTIQQLGGSARSVLTKGVTKLFKPESKDERQNDPFRNVRESSSPRDIRRTV